MKQYSYYKRGEMLLFIFYHLIMKGYVNVNEMVLLLKLNQRQKFTKMMSSIKNCIYEFSLEYEIVYNLKEKKYFMIKKDENFID